MKKTLTVLTPLLILAFVLAACGTSAPAGSDSELATKVASILTSYPTQPLPPTKEPTKALPTVATVEPTAEPTATLAPSATPTAEPTSAPTETAAPSEQATQQATAAATQAPTATSGPTLTPPAGDPATKLGKATATDEMDSEIAWTWPTGANDFTSVRFADGKMALKGLTKDPGWRLPYSQELADIYVEMTVEPGKCVAGDNYGIIFRIPVFDKPESGYLFAVSCDGKFALWQWDGTVTPKGKFTMLSNWKASSAIQTGEGKSNRVGVMALGSRLLMYVNGELVGEVKDTQFTKGYFGAFVNPDSENGFTIYVDKMSYWANPKP